MTEDKSIYVKVTTEDRSVIAVEVIIEKEVDTPKSFPTISDVKEHGELKIFKCPCTLSFRPIYVFFSTNGPKCEFEATEIAQNK